MATIFDVARYICEQKGSVTTMKLQKLCYYSQAWSLAWDELPLFNEDFEAWANGPVCPALFNMYKGLFEIYSNNIVCGDSNNLDENQKDTINKVLEGYGDKHPHELSELTHVERPWQEARKNSNVRLGDRCNAVVSKETMLDYYAGLIDEQARQTFKQQ